MGSGDPTVIKILVFVILIYSIVLHEIAHGWAALKLGDPTARNEGRLTLNPIPHIDPFMTIILPLLMYLMGGIIIGAAKPVPVNPFFFRNKQKGMFLVAAAGPLTNFAIAFVFAMFIRLGLASSPFNRMVFESVMFLNLFLMAFNLLPIPPLDGSRVVAYFLPRELAARYMSLERYGLLFPLLVIALGLHRPFVGFIMGLAYKLFGF